VVSSHESTYNHANYNTAYGWGNHAGLYDATGTAASVVSSHESTYNHANYNTAYDHSQLVSGNPHSVTPAELSLVIGTDIQAWDAQLDDIAALDVTDSTLIVGNGSTWVAETGATLRTSIGVDAAGTAAGLVSTHESTYNHENYNTAYDHSQLTTGNPHSVTRAELNLDTDDTPTFNQITLSSIPSNATHGVTKEYADALSGGGTFWSNVKAATTTNINLANGLEAGDIIDGYTLAADDRILVKDQTNSEENGLYVVPASGAASRATDADTAEEIENRKCIILSGTENVNKLFFCITTSITLETTPISFGELASSGQQGIVELIGTEYDTGGIYESPTGVNDLNNEWSNDTYAIDGNTGTAAILTAAGSQSHYQYGEVPIEFTTSGTVKSNKFRAYLKSGDSNAYAKGFYYDGSWHEITTYQLTTSPAWYTYNLPDIKNITKVKLDFAKSSQISIQLYIYEVEIWDIDTSAQYVTTLKAGTPTADYTLTFPDDAGVANNVMISNGSGVLLHQW